MEKKKLNIRASIVTPKKDPITSPIIKKEKEPNKDIDSKWVPFFKDSSNIYINDLAKRARRSSTHSSIINQKISFARGNGFVFYKDNEEVSYNDLEDNFREWLNECNSEGQSLRDIFTELVQDYVITGNCYPHIKKAGDYSALYTIDATKVRKSKDKKTAYISSFWRDILLDWTPSKDYPISELPFYNNRLNQKEYVKHIYRKYPEFDYYGLPDYVGALDWIDIEYRISKYNIDKFDNGFFPSAIIQQFGEPSEGETPKQYVERIRNAFTGEGNNDKILVELLDSPEQATKVVEFSREKDGEFQMLSDLSVNNIVAAHRITPSLAGFETTGKLGSNQQIRIEYDKFMNSVVIPDIQEPIINFINAFIKRETNFDIEIGVLNVAPIGISHLLDVNSITTVNEGRNMLGLEPLEDEVLGMSVINSNNKTNGI